MAENDLKTMSRAYVRLARDCVGSTAGQSEGTHRAGMPAMIQYGLGEITDGVVGALASPPGLAAGMTKFETGFHYHDCEMQIVIVLDGATDAVRDGGVMSRVGKGDVSLIPGGVPHGGTEPSADYQAVEITFPSDYQTIVCAAPAIDGAPSPSQTWGRGEAVRTDEERGLIKYAYPVAAPYAADYGIEFERRTRAVDFEPGELRHGDAMQVLMVLAGSRDVNVEGTAFSLAHSDLLLIPEGATCQDIAASSDFEGVWVRRLKA